MPGVLVKLLVSAACDDMEGCARLRMKIQTRHGEAVQLASTHALHSLQCWCAVHREWPTLASASGAATTGDDRMRFDASVCSVDSSVINQQQAFCMQLQSCVIRGSKIVVGTLKHSSIHNSRGNARSCCMCVGTAGVDSWWQWPGVMSRTFSDCSTVAESFRIITF